MLRLLLASLLSFVLVPLCSQSWQWVQTGGGSAGDAGYKINLSAGGEIYCVGGSGSNIVKFGNFSYTPNNGPKTFLGKFSSEGQPLAFSFSFLDPNPDMTISKPGNPYWSFTTSATQVIDSLTINPTDLFGYLVKFDDNANVLEAKNLYFKYPSAIDADEFGNLYSVGSYSNNGGLTLKMRFSKIDEAGANSWEKIGVGGNGAWRDCAYRNGLLYLSGWMDTCVTFDTTTFCPTNASTAVIGRADTSGHIHWIKSIETPIVLAYNVDNEGNTYFTGEFNQDMIVHGIPLHKNPNATYNMFLSKYDSLGNFQWIRQINSDNFVAGAALSSGGPNGIYVAGTLRGTATFGSQVVSSPSIAGNMFVARYNTEGDCLGVRVVPDAYPKEIVEDSVSNVYVTGSFNQNTQFDNVAANTLGGFDFFLAKLSAITALPARIDYNTELTIYPNPGEQKFTIEVPEDIVRRGRAILRIYDYTGKSVKEEAVEIEDSKVAIDMGVVTKGLYTVTLTAAHKKFTGRVRVE